MSDKLVDLVVEEPAWNEVLPGIEVHAGIAARLAVEAAGLDPQRWTICLLACDDARIAELNREFRGKAEPTNVLSWPDFELEPEHPGAMPALPPQTGSGPRQHLGNVAIALQTICHESESGATPLKDHVIHLILHGCLHLLGFDHETDANAETMERVETRALAQIAVVDPYMRNDAASRIQTDREMQEGQSTTPSLEGAPSEKAISDDDESQPSRSFITKLFQRASNALAPDTMVTGSDAEARLRAAFGPAFRDTTPAELAMVTNILRLREMRVVDVMVPRADIVSVPEVASLAEVVAAFERGSLSRLPVYRETLDDPIGFVHLKDVALAHGVGADQASKAFRLSDYIRKALFVPPSMQIAALLQRMQAARVHMALVIDEFGGVDGLVTIEDMVEQIVGDIEDEHDSAEIDQWLEEVPGIFSINARADIRDFEGAEGVHLLMEDWDEDIDTFGGLVFMLCGRVPAQGEVITHPNGYEFEITEADPRRVKHLRMILNGAGNGTEHTKPLNGAEE